MKIEFTNHIFTKQTLKLHNAIAVLLGANRSGKTTVLDTLSQGLRGKLKDFTVNGNTVGAGDYQVLYLKDDFDLKEEIKFTRSSPFRNHLLQRVNQLLLEQKKYASVTEQVKDLAQSVEKIISHLFAEQLHAFTEPQITLQFDTQKITLENIIDHLLAIKLFDRQSEQTLDNKGLNRFLLRMLVFNVLRSALNEQDEQRPIVILFDLPELYTTPQTIHLLNQTLKQLLRQKHFFLIVASNNPSYIADLAPSLQALHFLRTPQIVRLRDVDATLQKVVAAYTFLTSDEYSDWNWFYDDFRKVFHSADLDREWKWFRQHVYRDFLHHTYFASVLLQDEADVNCPNQTDGLITIYSASVKKLLGNYFFLLALNVKLSWSSQIFKKHSKLNLFLNK